jgi:signal recognition particle receptor subunit beta
MAGAMNARILYWGIAGAGKTTNLTTIHARLRADHRGELRRAATRLDPTVTYEVLPIQLGEVGGVPIEIEIVSVPDGAEQAPTRKQLLDEVSGIVLVVDASPARADENVGARDELAESLASYGRDLTDLPVVVQYNKRDLVDDNVIEALHRRLSLPSTAVFEAVAVDGTGVLQTLTTVSKAVVKNLRDANAAAARPVEPLPEPVQEPEQEAAVEIEPIGTPAPVYDAEAMAARAAVSHAGEPEAYARSERQTPADASARLLENALESQAMAPDADLEADEALEHVARASFDASFEQLSRESKPRDQISLGPDLRIVSVGTATREDERSVRIPLVLGDARGGTASLALTISLEGLLDEADE